MILGRETVGVLDGPFHLPVSIDYAATALWAVTGALVAARRRFDIAGIVALATVSAAGGGILRDGLFLSVRPPRFLQSPVYMAIIVVAALVVLQFGRFVVRLARFDAIVSLVDGAAIPAYALVGMTISRAAGLGLAASAFIGVVNAVGGGVLRDVLVGRTPEIFQPGVPTAIAALASCAIFIGLTQAAQVGETLAALVAIAVVFAIRAVALRYDLRTHPARGFDLAN